MEAQRQPTDAGSVLSNIEGMVKSLTVKLKKPEERFENLKNYNADLESRMIAIDKALSKLLRVKSGLYFFIVFFSPDYLFGIKRVADFFRSHLAT